jgi:hypothetical protein
MDSETFVKELDAVNQKTLDGFGTAGPAEGGKGNLTALLKVALTNEISVAELASFWMPDAPDWQMKITLARQAGDEARHFQLVEKRLGELGVELRDFQAPPVNPLFEFLRSLKSPAERVAAGMLTLESVAWRVNEEFLGYAEKAGDAETARIYREYIQPDEKHHHALAARLLTRYAVDPESQRRAREAAGKTLELARTLRAAAKQRLGASCLPGC